MHVVISQRKETVVIQRQCSSGISLLGGRGHIPYRRSHYANWIYVIKLRDSRCLESEAELRELGTRNTGRESGVPCSLYGSGPSPRCVSNLSLPFHLSSPSPCISPLSNEPWKRYECHGGKSQVSASSHDWRRVTLGAARRAAGEQHFRFFVLNDSRGNRLPFACIRELAL